MPRGASPKREHEFEKLKHQHQFHHDHRYPGREEEVAARIVNKQRSESGETKSASGTSTGSKSVSHGSTAKRFSARPKTSAGKSA